MPTNFPTGVDNFTNPTANDSLNLPSHSTQHANANDAIEAVEAYLLNGAGNSGLVKIIPTGATNGTVQANGNVLVGTTVASVTVSGAFSATYDNYKILYTDGVASTIVNMLFSFPTAVTAYYSSRIYNTPLSGTPAGNGQSNTANWGYFGGASQNYMNVNCDVLSPFKTQYTRYSGVYMVDDGANTTFGTTQGFLANGTSYSSFTLTPSTGTITGGNIRIYGYK
jgi:hypothetical protein